MAEAISAADVARAAEELLTAAAYAMQAADGALLALCAEHVAQEIKNDCNLLDIPAELCPCAARLTAAQFLTAKRATGDLSGFANVDFSPAVKQIQEGDTNIAYDTSHTQSQAELLDSWISQLAACRRGLIAFRRLRW